MRIHWTSWAAVFTLFVLAFAAAQAVLPPQAMGNGGPFVVKYPGGDPAAKGVLARLDPSLKPAKETRLRVVKEDLSIRFGTTELYRMGDTTAEPPVVGVSAVYTIENPTDKEVQVDFGFPILRGIYISPFAMMSRADAAILVDKKFVNATVISNSAIYGLIRQNAREVIEKGIAGDRELARLVAAVRGAWADPQAAVQQAAVPVAASAHTAAPSHTAAPERRPTAAYLPACDALQSCLTAVLRWNPRDAALMVQYASLEFPGTEFRFPRDRWDGWLRTAPELAGLKRANLGAVAAIGDQKATQLFAQLASRFDEKAGSDYEAIFAAWGGDVRERSIDLASGQVRPREISLPTRASGSDWRLTADPTVYARVDYLDPNAKITQADKASCEAVLKNLPVTFTFAPMNLLYYQVKFPARGTRVVAVEYRQYAYADTRGTGSYQLAYVLHPASLWKDFGPIHVTVIAPKGILCRASVPLGEGREEPPAAKRPKDVPPSPVPPAPAIVAYQATLDGPEQKRGELFVGVDKAAWDAMFPPAKPKPAPAAQRSPILPKAPPPPPAAAQTGLRPATARAPRTEYPVPSAPAAQPAAGPFGP